MDIYDNGGTLFKKNDKSNILTREGNKFKEFYENHFILGRTFGLKISSKIRHKIPNDIKISATLNTNQW